MSDLNEAALLMKTMANDMLLSDVLQAYDATERALATSRQHSDLLPEGFDLVFRLRGIHESLFRIRADLEEGT